jgi:hypothetical protein
VSAVRVRITSCVSGLWHTYRNWRYAILFYSLLFTLAVGPLRSVLGFRAGMIVYLMSHYVSAEDKGN